MTRIVVEPEAFRHVEDYHFDDAFYHQYLSDRGIPEADIEDSQIVITEKPVGFSGHGAYEPRQQGNDAQPHTITMTTRYLSPDPKKQGRLLRHETEHFIYQIDHPHHIRNRKILTAAWAIGGTVLGGIYGAHIGHNISHGLSLYATVPIETGTTLTGAGLVGAATAINAAISHVAVGPSELQAEWAEWRRRHQLPDGTLQLSLR